MPHPGHDGLMRAYFDGQGPCAIGQWTRGLRDDIVAELDRLWDDTERLNNLLQATVSASDQLAS